jgi:cytochrome c553
MRCTLFLLAAALGLGALQAAAADEEARLKRYGRHLAQECAACHRMDGIDAGIPPINGWEVERFIATLGAYQTGERSNPAMGSVARSLDADQVRALATYFAALPKPPAKK